MLAYARAVQDPTASVALARILLGPRYRVGFKDLALVARLATVQTKQPARRLRARPRTTPRPSPFLLAEALEHLDEIEGLSDEARARLGAFRDELARAARRGAPAGRRVPVRGDPADRHPRGARRRARPGPRADRAAEPRRVPRRGARLRAGRGRADAPRVPRLRRRGRAARQAGVGAGAALRRRLGQGHDDPRREGAGVRPRLRAGVRPRARCRTRRSRRTRPSAASRSTSSCAATPTSCPATTATCRGSAMQLKAQEIIEERRTAYVALTRARADAPRQRRLLVRRQHLPEEAERVPRTSCWSGERTSGLATVEPGPAEAGDDNPMLGPARAVRPRLAGPGAARPPTIRCSPTGWRAAALEPAASSRRCSRRSTRDARRLRRARGRSAEPRRPTCSSARGPTRRRRRDRGSRARCRRAR